MTDFETRAAARLDAAVRKTLQEGQLDAEAAAVAKPPPLAGAPGRDAHAIAVHGNGNVIYVGGLPPSRDARVVVVPRRRWRTRLSVLAATAALVVCLVAVAAFASGGARFFAHHVSRSLAGP